ncbi:MAG: hypothetical protein ACRC9G_15230 [Aeromonas veronii]
MKFEELQGKRVVFSGEGVPLSIRTKAWQAGALIGVTVNKETDAVITTNANAPKSRRAQELGIPVIPASQML